jgi:hypothetical protein
MYLPDENLTLESYRNICYSGRSPALWPESHTELLGCGRLAFHKHFLCMDRWGGHLLSNFQETRRIVNSGRWPVHFFVYLAVSSFVKSCKLAASRSLRGASVQEFLIQISRCARTNSIPYDSLELLDSNQLCFHPDSSLCLVRWLQKGGSSSTTAPFGTE